MSVLRFSRPGIAGTTLVPIDDGASPRIDRARAGTLFTPLTDAVGAFTGMTQPKPAKSEYKPRALTVVPRCGRPLRSGEPCYRRPGHGEGCRDKAAVERDNARRRARDYGSSEGSDDLVEPTRG